MPFETAPTSLRATRISAGLRPVLDGAQRRRDVIRVVSVHRAVVNVMVGEGRLIAIANEAVGGLPNGILVGADPDFTTLGICPGMVGDWVAGRLHIPAARLVVGTDRASDWSPRVVRREVEDWPRRSERAWGLARVGRVRGGLEDIPIARPALEALDASIRDGDRTAAAAAARGLIGLGPGLTPAGDDALAGVESALYAVGHPAAGFLAAALLDVETRTTTLSVALLRHAARGEASERVQRLLDGLLGPDPSAMAAAITLAVRHGATSGSDLLAGVLVGLDAATGEPAAAAEPTVTGHDRAGRVAA